MNHSGSSRARLAVSIGCPSGIGPEVSVVGALAHHEGRPLLVGDARVIRRALVGRGLDPARVVEVSSAREGFHLPDQLLGVWTPPGTVIALEHAALGRSSAEGGAAQLAWIDAALDLVTSREADALVTGPVNKNAVASSGRPGAELFLGHTEHLQRRLGATEVVMAFASEAFTTALVTTHLPLRAVPRAVTEESVGRAAYWLADFLLAMGATKPVAVAALNPHAGEGGLLGDEEARSIGPGIARAKVRLGARAARIEIVGPIPAETAFRLAATGAFSGVVAMYHDQATIPMKLVGFGEAVNVSLGLGLVRTSVDHGTAYDRAPRFDADARGMAEALTLAARLVRTTATAAPRTDKHREKGR